MGGFGTEGGAALRQHKTSRCQADPELSLYLRRKREGERRGEEIRKGREEEGRRKREKSVGQSSGIFLRHMLVVSGLCAKMSHDFLTQTITFKEQYFLFDRFMTTKT